MLYGIQELILYSSLFLTLFFEVFILITYLEVRQELDEETKLIAKKIIHFPSATIIVPCLNEEKTVGDTLRSILNLNYPKDKLSIIAVDDGSTDKTLSALRKFKHHPQVKILSKDNGGKHTALNLALEHVETDLVGCLDADSFVDPDALGKIVPFFDDKTTMAVTPSIKVYKPTSLLQYLQKIEYNWSVFLRRILSSLGALYVTPGPFSIFRTQVFRELGNYRAAHNTEDMEIALRMQKSHHKIVNSYTANVYTVTPKKLSALLRQRVRWTYGFLNNAIDYKELFFNKKYGHIGLVVLPLGVSSIFTTIYIITNAVASAISRIFDTAVRVYTVGWNINLEFPSFDWYFINTGTLSFLAVSTLVLTLTILYLALHLSEGKVRISKGLVYYLLLYSFLAPLWLSKSLFNTALRRPSNWR